MPKLVGAEFVHWSLRLTPSDQEPIADWSSLLVERYSGTRILVFQEGGEDTDCKLHYHLYISSRISKSHLQTLSRQLAREDKEFTEIIDGKTVHTKMGNNIFSLKLAHGNTIGYACKQEDLVFSFGFTEDEIDIFYERSRQWRKDMENAKKTKQRAKISFLQVAMDAVRQKLGERPLAEKALTRTPAKIYTMLEHEYGARPLPSRGMLETAIVSLCSPEYRRQYYLRNLPETFSNY